MLRQGMPELSTPVLGMAVVNVVDRGQAEALPQCCQGIEIADTPYPVFSASVDRAAVARVDACPSVTSDAGKRAGGTSAHLLVAPLYWSPMKGTRTTPRRH